MSGGVFAITRDLMDHPIFKVEPYTEPQAFIWLVGEASWKPRRVRVGNAVAELARGQCAFATRFLAKKWGWSDASVRRFLKKLKSDAMIDAQSDSQMTLITICNYDKYQKVSLPNDAQNDAPDDADMTRERRKLEDRGIQGIQETNIPSGSASALPAMGSADMGKPITLDAQVYRLGRQILGASAGGMVTKLKEACSGDLELALLALQEAAEKGDPRSWVQRRIKTLPSDLAYAGCINYQTAMTPLVKPRPDWRQLPEYRGCI